MGQRRRSRERALHAVFSQHFTGYAPDRALERLVAGESERPVAPPDDFTRALVQKASEERRAIEEAIAGSLQNWTLERLDPAVGSALRLGTAELLFFPDIDAPTTINEYIELARSYADDDAAKLVNAVLDRIRKSAGR